MVDALGIAIGGSTTLALPVVAVGLSLTLAGSAGMVAPASVDRQATAAMGGSSALTPLGGFVLEVEAPMGGSSSMGAALTGPTTPQDAQGTALGEAVLLGLVLVDQGAGGLSQGSSTAQADASGLVLATAQAVGGCVVEGWLSVPAEGVAQGTSDASASGGIFLEARAYCRGSGSVRLSIPDVLRGTSSTAAHFVVERIPPPILATPSVPTFRWGQVLQKGDLILILTDLGTTLAPMGTASDRTPISPYRLVYALYRKMPGGVSFLVGPPERYPVKCITGAYYAVFTAGEGGQPGDWEIRWRWQRSFGSPFGEASMAFRVLDAVLAGVPDPDRRTKTGWGE